MGLSLVTQLQVTLGSIQNLRLEENIEFVAKSSIIMRVHMHVDILLHLKTIVHELGKHLGGHE